MASVNYNLYFLFFAIIKTTLYCLIMVFLSMLASLTDTEMITGMVKYRRRSLSSWQCGAVRFMTGEVFLIPCTCVVLSFNSYL
jgi:hypothetical protein